MIPKKKRWNLIYESCKKLFRIKWWDSIFLWSIYVVCIFRRALNVQIYIIFVIWLSCRNGKLKKIWQFSYHEKYVWLWLGLTIRVTHRIYWPKSNVKFIMHALWNVFRKKWTKLNWMNKPYHCITVYRWNDIIIKHICWTHKAIRMSLSIWNTNCLQS